MIANWALFIWIVSAVAATMSNTVTYEEVKDLPNHPEKFLFDVREPIEIAAIGAIPRAVNVPCRRYFLPCKFLLQIFFYFLFLVSEVAVAFSDLTSSEEFEKKYNGVKPQKDDFIIFSCRSGRRSQLALDAVAKLGYTK